MEAAETFASAASGAGSTDSAGVLSQASGKKPAVERLSSGAHQAVDKIANVAGQAADTLGEKSEQLKLATDKAMEGGRSYVSNHPLASLGIAVTAGIVIGQLIRSR